MTIDDCDVNPANRGRSVCFGMNYYFIIEPQCIIITRNDSTYFLTWFAARHGHWQRDGGTSTNNMNSFIFMKRTHFIWAPFISWQMRRMTRQTRISNLIFQSSFCRFTFRFIFVPFFLFFLFQIEECVFYWCGHINCTKHRHTHTHACATNVQNDIQLNCGLVRNCIGNHKTYSKQQVHGRRTTIGATGENLICKLQIISKNVCEH